MIVEIEERVLLEMMISIKEYGDKEKKDIK